MDWTNVSGDISRLDAAERAGYYQGLAGYTAMNRSRALGRNIYEKLADTDPTGYRYRIVSVYSHGNSERVVLRPKDGEGSASCLYNSDSQDANHNHNIGDQTFKCVQQSRLRSLSNVPTCLWFHVQGCNTAETARQANLRGVRTTSGFDGKITAVGMGWNFRTPAYNFSAKYWKSLDEGKPQANALLDGRDQVEWYHFKYLGYDKFKRYGVNGCI